MLDYVVVPCVSLGNELPCKTRRTAFSLTNWPLDWTKKEQCPFTLMSAVELFALGYKVTQTHGSLEQLFSLESVGNILRQLLFSSPRKTTLQCQIKEELAQIVA